MFIVLLGCFLISQHCIIVAAEEKQRLQTKKATAMQRKDRRINTLRDLQRSVAAMPEGPVKDQLVAQIHSLQDAIAEDIRIINEFAESIARLDDSSVYQDVAALSSLRQKPQGLSLSLSPAAAAASSSSSSSSSAASSSSVVPVQSAAASTLSAALRVPEALKPSLAAFGRAIVELESESRSAGTKRVERDDEEQEDESAQGGAVAPVQAPVKAGRSISTETTDSQRDALDLFARANGLPDGSLSKSKRARRDGDRA